MRRPDNGNNMKVKFFEHIVHAAAPGLTRAMLWAGLERTVRRPQDYIDHVEGAEISAEEIKNGETKLDRIVDFGRFSVADRVILKFEDSVQTLVDGGENWPASSFLIKIEEPEQGVLFLRFLYEEEKRSDEADNPMINTLRRKAYEAKDQRLVEQILEEELKNAPSA